MGFKGQIPLEAGFESNLDGFTLAFTRKNHLCKCSEQYTTHAPLKAVLCKTFFYHDYIHQVY